MEIHPKFKLNGLKLSEEELIEVAYSLIKEGENHEKAIGDFLMDWFSPHSSVVVKTSGSTGSPKKISLQKQNMVNSAVATGIFFDLTEGDSALLCLSADYIAGKMMLVRSLILGLELDYVAPTSSPLSNHSKCYDFCAMVPLQVENSLDRINQLQKLIIGGAALSSSLREELVGNSNQIFETYGMTETITHVAVRKIGQEYFQALPEIKISVDERGCLVIEAPNIVETLVVTNDVVKIISNTEFKWLGRIDNVINSGGIKLIPEEIEKKLSSQIQNRFFVAGVDDKSLGQKLIIIIEGQPDKTKYEKLIRGTKSLEKYEIPKDIVFVEKLTQTDSGKVNRNKTLSEAL